MACVYAALGVLFLDGHAHADVGRDAPGGLRAGHGGEVADQNWIVGRFVVPRFARRGRGGRGAPLRAPAGRLPLAPAPQAEPRGGDEKAGQAA